MLHLFIFLSTVVAFVFCDKLNGDQLLSVVVIYRHGDRTPTNPYPKDPYRNVSFWPVDFGQLTNLGKQQQFALGQWLRDRYGTFLPDKYSENDIHVQSTDVDRTLMSAAANLAGLYPPKDDQIWDQQLPWQPIPIHTIPEKQDSILGMKKSCPKYDLLLKQLLKSPPFSDINKRNHDLYAYLTRQTGAVVNSLETVEYIYNTLFIEELYNHTLPEWTKAVFPAKMKPLADLSFATACYTSDLARLKTGPLFNQIVNHFNRAANVTVGKHTPLPKLWMYSAHDTTIANVLNTLHKFEYHCPPYASMVLFELKYDGDFYIDAFYKNTSEPSRLVLQCNNSTRCSLKDFASFLGPILIDADEWEKECKNYLFGIPYTDNQRNIMVIFLSLLLTSLTGLVLLVAFLKCRKERHATYLRLPNDEIATY